MMRPRRKRFERRNAEKLREALKLDSPAGRSPGKPSELPVQEKPQKQKPTAAKSRPKSNAKKPRNSNAKKSPKSGGSPKKAVVSPKSRGSPKKAVVSPKSDGSPKKAKAVVSPKSRCSPKKAVVSPKSGRSPKAKAISPKSGCSLRGKLGMKKMVMKKHKDGKKELKMTRRHIYSRAYHDIYTKKGGTKKQAGAGGTLSCKLRNFNPLLHS